MMNHSNVAHNWAHRVRPEGKGHNMYYQGDTIYSYGSHFPMARLVGSEHVLFTTRTYSVSTAKHLSYTRSAITHLTVFHVADVTRDPDSRTMEEYQKRIDELLLKSSHAIKYMQLYLDEADELFKEARLCAKVFNIPYKYLPKMPTKTRMEELRRRAAAKAAADRAARKHKEERADALFLENLREWLGTPPLAYMKRGYEYCRLGVGSEDVPILFTTKGASVPLDHVKKAMPLVLSLIREGKTYQRNGHSIHLGDYVLDSIDENGTVRVGCHTFQKKEVERINSLIC